MRFSLFRSAIFAGIAIGIAGFGYLVDQKIGMFLFPFGLAAVVHYRLKLFTGTAGFVQTGKDCLDLLVILGGNVIGCLLVSMLARCSAFDLQTTAETILQNRLDNTWWRTGFLSIGCGFLMTTAVTFARRSNEFAYWIPLLLGVPMFILCGFPHCIADSFYYLCCQPATIIADPQLFLLYPAIILGNFIGCNLYRLFVDKKL